MLHRRVITGLLLLVLSGGVTAALPMTDSQGKPLPSLAPMLRDVNPAVVNIATYSTTQYANNPLLNDPFFRYFFDLPDASSRSPQKQQRSAGSGVIVDAQQGIVLTNFHVINGADEVQVSLIDGRSAQATVLGADPDLDIAVLQIQARPLQAVPLADSNDVQVGDFVVAIGNPFGLGQTVTTGIVSALGRSGLGIEGFENFIQTDASINPGNFGGALVNLNGELVGINTAILAPSGGNVGIGFAIPINMAKASLNQIVRYGEVKRGQIGISVQDLTPMLREAFALPPGQIGVLIADVIQGSNAEQVGLQAGDIILKIDGQPVMSANQLRSLFATYEIGKGMTLTVVRNGNERAVKILVEDPNQLLRLDDQLHPLLKGVTFAMNRDNRLQIDAMQPNSRAAYAGLRPGDIVLAVNQVNVKDLEQLQRVLAQAKGELLIKIARNNRAFYAVLR